MLAAFDTVEGSILMVVSNDKSRMCFYVTFQKTRLFFVAYQLKPAVHVDFSLCINMYIYIERERGRETKILENTPKL